LSESAYLPDVNILIALSDPEHTAHDAAVAWHQSISSARFFLCPVTEASFVRLMTNPLIGGESMSGAILLLREIAALPNVAHLPVAPTWLELVEPIARRLVGHRQVTDALLLGLAIRNEAILVTLDRAIQALAGAAYAANVLTLA
jgi:toxin-antitoxin system PIN domain toxin